MPQLERQRGHENFSQLLAAIGQTGEGDTVSVGELLDRVGRRSFGPLILLVGFISLSPLTMIPGASWVMAAVTLLISAQIVIGMPHPWLPRRLLEFRFRREHLAKAVEMAREPAHVADRLTAPRLVFLSVPPFLRVTALFCVLAALVTFPLGFIPFGPMLPSIAVLMFGIGLTARDGYLLLVSGAALAGAVAAVAAIRGLLPF